MDITHKRLISYLLALGLVASMSGCGFANTDSQGSEANPISTISNSVETPEFSFVNIYDVPSLEVATTKYGVTFADMPMFDSVHGKGWYYASDVNKLYEISGIVNGSIKRNGSTITFEITTDPSGLYHLDITTDRVTRGAVVEDIFQVPEDESEIKKIYYGGYSKDKWVEIYEVNGHLYMCDKFENPDEYTYYSVDLVNSVDNFEMYAVRKRVNGDVLPDSKPNYLGFQYLLVDCNKELVARKGQINDSVADIDGAVRILGVSGNTVTIGRKIEPDEYSKEAGVERYTGIEIFKMTNPKRDYDDNAYVVPVRDIMALYNHVAAFMGKPSCASAFFTQDTILYTTNIPNVYLFNFPTSEWMIIYPDGDVQYNYCGLDCGSVPPKNLRLLADSKTGALWIAFEGKDYGEDTKGYYRLSTHSLYNDSTLPENVSLVPCEVGDEQLAAVVDRHALYDSVRAQGMSCK